MRKQTDGCYLLDCQNNKDDTVASGVGYHQYVKEGGWNWGQAPYDYQAVSNGSSIDWEIPGSVRFEDTGITFSWNINANASVQPVNASVGTATNYYEDFDVFKASDAALYSYQQGTWTCNAMFWAY